MINRLLEWHRIISVQPSPDTLDRRTNAVLGLVRAYDEAYDSCAMLGAEAGVVAGFEKGYAQDDPAVVQIITSLRGHDSTVSEYLTENALELQRSSGLTALGEMMTRNPDKPVAKDAVLVALLIQSGMGIRPLPTGKHLHNMINELGNAARQTLARAQREKRHRTPLSAKKLALDETTADAAGGQ